MINKMVILILLIVFVFSISALSQSNDEEQLKILTEIGIDVKYIKGDISEIKVDQKEIKKEMENVGTRVTKVEERQIVIKEDVNEVTGRNNWATGLIGSILLLMLGLQLKRSYAHRKNDGRNSHQINKISE